MRTRPDALLLALALAGEAAAQPKDDGRAPVAPDPAIVGTEPYILRPPFTVADGLTFGARGAPAIRLAGLDGPAARAICLDDKDLPWACGLQARAALHRLLGGATYRCVPAGMVNGDVLARCDAAGADLGERMVRLGFARPTNAGDTPGLSAARAATAGLWRGGWRLRE